MTSRPQVMVQPLTAFAAAVALLYFFRGILIPLVLAGALAMLVNGLARFIGGHARGMTQWAITILTAVTVIGGAIAAMFIITRGMVGIAHNIPALLTRIDLLVHEAGRALDLNEELSLKKLTGDINVPRLIGQVVGGAGSFVSGLLLLVTYFGFIVAGRGRIGSKVKTLAGAGEASAGVEEDLRNIPAVVETYVRVQTVTGLMIASVSAGAMLAVGLDNVLFWTVALFLLCYIPVIGVTVGSIFPALFALLQFQTWWQAALIFAAIQIVATIVGNVIYPRMQADTQNIDPVATLVALAFWTILWGLAGAFLAVPLTLIGLMICARIPSVRWIAVLLSDDGSPSFSRSAAVK